MNATHKRSRNQGEVRGRVALLGGLPAAAVVVALALLAAFWGCGDVSLLNILEQEWNAAPLDVKPDGRYLPVSWPITLSVSGGVEPYSYDFEPPIGTWNPEDGLVTYTAPGSISEEIKEVTLVVTDFLGNKKSVKVKIHRPLQVEPAVFTLEVGQTQDITVSGGVPLSGGPQKYTPVYSGGGSVAETANPHVFQYTASSIPGKDSIVFKDAAGTALGTVTVAVTVTAVGALAVNPASAVINPGESVSFVVTGGSSGTYSIGQSPPAPGGGATMPPLSASDGDTVIYTAPDVLATDLFVTVTVSDDPDSVDFKVQVQAPPAAPLSVAYNPDKQGNKIKIAPGDTITVTASGGRLPYTFEVPERAGAISVPDPTNHPEVALYTAVTGNAKKVSETIVVSDSAAPPAVSSVAVEIQKP
jgi:hypothetical protein